MAVWIAVLIISGGAIASGWSYVKTARRMRSFHTTRGTVIGREVAPAPVGGREGRWGRGGGYRPKVTYTYVVDGVEYTSDRWSYAVEGLKHQIAEQRLSAVPNEVEVHYDSTAPDRAFLVLNTPRLGYALIGGGALGVLMALVAGLALLT